MQNKQLLHSGNHLQVQKRFLPHIQDDATALFSGHKSGHVGYMRYGAPLFEGDQVLGAQFWYNSQQSDDYYLSREENALLKKILSSDELPRNGFDTLVDFGPGDIYAIANKTIPLVQALRAKRYLALDMCENYARDAAVCLATSAKVDSSYRIGNFFTKDLEISLDNSFMFMAGSTITNMPIDRHVKDSTLHLVSFFTRIRRMVKNGKGQFLIGYDANNDAETLNRAYNNNPPVSRFYQNAMWMIERDSDSSFDPSNFVYEGRWVPEEHRFAHYLVVQKNCSVLSGGNEYYFHEGAALHIDNSYKFPPEMMSKAAENAGWKTKKIWTETGRVHYMLFEAI